MFTSYRILSLIIFSVSPFFAGLIIGGAMSTFILIDKFDYYSADKDLSILLLPVIFGPVYGLFVGFFPALLTGIAFIFLEKQRRIIQESLTIVIGALISYYQASNQTGPDMNPEYFALVGGITAFIVGQIINRYNKKKRNATNPKN